MTARRCVKPGCNALRLVGHPCTDWDCPQQAATPDDVATARTEARNQALKEAAEVHGERVQDLRQNLRFVRNEDQKASIEHAITIHEDSATAIRALIAPDGEG